MRLNIDEAEEVLVALGCSLDPIIVNGVETEATELSYLFDGHVQADRCQIGFWGKRSKVIYGTVADMILDRLEVPHIKKKKRFKIGRK